MVPGVNVKPPTLSLHFLPTLDIITSTGGMKSLFSVRSQKREIEALIPQILSLLHNMLSFTPCIHQNNHNYNCHWSISRPDTQDLTLLTHISGSHWYGHCLNYNISICFQVKSQWLVPRIWLAAVRLVQKDRNRTTNIHINWFSKLGGKN